MDCLTTSNNPSESLRSRDGEIGDQCLNNNRDKEVDSYDSKRLSCNDVDHDRTGFDPLLRVFLMSFLIFS